MSLDCFTAQQVVIMHLSNNMGQTIVLFARVTSAPMIDWSALHANRASVESKKWEGLWADQVFNPKNLTSIGLPSIKKEFYFEAESTRDMTTSEVATFRCMQL